MARVFERLVYDQLSSYMDKNKYLSKYQSGFRKCHSTVTSMLRNSNDWLFNMDRGNYNGVVFFDIKKAFDTVDHKKNITPSIFADDTGISVSSDSVPDIQRLLREDISAIQCWMHENKLTLNALKTEFILIASKPRLKEIEETCCIDVQGETIYIGHITLNR